ncbi:MAG: methionine adenosyltransferase [Clostridia bacterium]|jgi:S-adenosylmethionine synthetase|nr:methionine adenosyltransferase [Clostridia bacterium]MBQ9343092.1 methionine adenosyltransferase [Clostridia bacterium]
MRKLFTSESVTEGHPDKVCDQISDAVLDDMLRQDPTARVACETCTTTGLVLVMGEVTTTGYTNIEEVARRVINEIGYNNSSAGFDGNSCSVLVAVHGQSPDISQGVTATENHEQGAGDQGMMFGYACTETPELMPMPIALSHRLTRRMAEVRKGGLLPWMRPDGKAQVTVAYENGRPVAVDAVVISTQHDEAVSQNEIRRAMIEEVIRHEIPAELLHRDTKYYINPTGRFVIGGPAGDSGLTGRKIIVDTYGGYCPHGGGAFSGKDPSKVDRSAAYAARHAAKNLVAAGLCERAQVAVAYAIGVARPVSLTVDTFGTGKLPDDRLAELVNKHFDMRPAAIIDRLQLRRPIYRATAAYGHFGRSGFSWEKVDMADRLRADAGI